MTTAPQPYRSLPPAAIKQPDRARFMQQFVSWDIAIKADKWQGLSTGRWRSDAFDADGSRVPLTA